MADQPDDSAQQPFGQNVLTELRGKLNLSAAGRGAVNVLVKAGCLEPELLSWLYGLSSVRAWAKGKKPASRNQYKILPRDARALAGQINSFIETRDGGALVAEGAMKSLAEPLLRFAELMELTVSRRSGKATDPFAGRASLVAYVEFRTRRPHDREVAQLLTEVTHSPITAEALAVWRGKNQQKMDYIRQRLRLPPK